ncbi:KamA family radical SAM protein [Oceanidesulfovibrio marinus]|uniref:KamA family radical SAM protein n=1 Tax=Oceanidesulfovibrio marinus TaxID=370038 RepID=A0A6P1ZEN8_9BACT|nr:KamA family radical SAM protein [Oceanidesulfovibrio marinus]QJT09650.1 KamA family radical SAM protein [Oceanidesulfovibrio marinus]TVM31012.1 lysine 2,3-aminomutase [Oceanidesulfovibrio marinus]
MTRDNEIEALEPPSSRKAAQTVRASAPKSKRTGFAMGEERDAFRKEFYPGVTRAEWNDWHWQIAHRVTSQAELFRHINPTPQETLAQGGEFPLAITPYYLSLVNGADPSCAIRRAVSPTMQEAVLGPGEADDPLGEEGHSPTPGLVHRYPDRVLFLSTDFCSTYCRYCTRSRLVGRGNAGSVRKRWDACLDYIAATPTVRDVVVSGGDPLTMPDEAIDYLLGRLRAISHVEIVRLGTKVPAVLPQRVTRDLVRMLRKHNPLFMSCHMMHPRELTPETNQAFERLADAGLPLGSQTVLLAGINDAPETLAALFHGLLKVRVRPYYLYQCDPIHGSAHFRTSVAKGVELMSALRGHTSGYAVPTYVIDAPGGGGKVPIYANTMLGRDEQGLALVNYEGRVYHYPDYAPEPVPAAADATSFATCPAGCPAASHAAPVVGAH